MKYTFDAGDLPQRKFLTEAAALGASALLPGCQTTGALDALRRIAPVSQYLYGTDYPFRDGAEVNGGLSKYDGFSAAELKAINRDNALRLFPHLKA